MTDISKTIVYEGDEDNLVLLMLCEASPLTVEEVQAKDVPGGKTSYIVETSVVQNLDQDWRDAWTYDSSSGFGIDMTKAKNIHRNNIRARREELMPALDIEFQRALETGADTSAIVAKKNALRDAPANSAIDACTTTDELQSQWDTSVLGATIYTI
jgi:hypothetical protein